MEVAQLGERVTGITARLSATGHPLRRAGRAFLSCKAMISRRKSNSMGHFYTYLG